MKKYILGMFLLTIFTLTAAAAQTDEAPIIGPLTITPTQPAPKATVTYSVTITGQNVPDEVHLWFKECNSQICHPPKNVTMTKNGATYSTQLTLSYSDATYVSAHVAAKIGTIWLLGHELNATLSAHPNNNTDNNTGKKTPGFETIPVFAAVAIALIIITRRKRS